MTNEDAQCLVIGALLGKRTWTTADLRVTLRVTEVAQRLAPLVMQAVSAVGHASPSPGQAP